MILRHLRCAPALIVPVFIAAVVALPGAGIVLAAQNAGANAETKNPPGTHTLNLKDADIQVLIATVSDITGKNFIVGPTVAGQGHGDFGDGRRSADEIYRTCSCRHAAFARLRRNSLGQHDQDRARRRPRSRTVPRSASVRCLKQTADEIVIADPCRSGISPHPSSCRSCGR